MAIRNLLLVGVRPSLNQIQNAHKRNGESKKKRKYFAICQFWLDFFMIFRIIAKFVFELLIWIYKFFDLRMVYTQPIEWI